MFLAGDVGGTKTRLGLFESKDGVLKRLEFERYESAKFPNLSAIIGEFLKGKDVKLSAACFGVPGPVKNGTVKVTNLPWMLSESEIAAGAKIPRVKLVNDLVSTAAAIPAFGRDDVLEVYAGEPDRPKDTFAIVAPGTGLGQAFLHIEDGEFTILPSEGGHANFSPVSPLERELHAYLDTRFHPVSIERLLCGPGLVNIYEFLRDTGKEAEEPELKERMASAPDKAAVISEFGKSGNSKICVRTLDLFISILGAHAANVVLTVLATGGVYLGGGIPPKISDLLCTDRLVSSYLNRMKLQEVVKATPIFIIKDDFASLNGAARLAQRLNARSA